MARLGSWQRFLSSASPKQSPGLTAILEVLVADDAPRLQTLRLGALRAVSSVAEYVRYRRQQIPVYRALEEELDSQVEASGENFSSLTGAAGDVWREHGSVLRRAPALEDEVRAITGASSLFVESTLFSEDEMLPPAVRQYVRRVRAAATLDGDLLLGHVYSRYAHCDLVFEADTSAPWMRAVGLAPATLDREARGPLLASIDRAADNLDDDKITAVYYEAARGFELNAKLVAERPLLVWGAAGGAWRLALASTLGHHL